MLGSLFNVEKITHDTIKDTLVDLSQELECEYADFFIMIKPKDADCNMQFFVYKMEAGVPKFVREIMLKEILNTE